MTVVTNFTFRLYYTHTLLLDFPSKFDLKKSETPRIEGESETGERGLWVETFFGMLAGGSPVVTALVAD